MQLFESLLSVVDTLLGPNGCPWDREQTFLSLQPFLLEEAHEVIEAVDANDPEKMREELGDLLFVVLFYAKLGEQSGSFTLEEILSSVEEKLIRRHPHIFAETVVKDANEVLKNWEKIKLQEKGGKEKGAAEGLPPTLPLLIRAQKILGRILKKEPTYFGEVPEEVCSEESLGDAFIALVLKAQKNGIDAESALRRALSRLND